MKEEDQQKLLQAIYRVSPVSFKIINIQKREFVNEFGWTPKHLGYDPSEFAALSNNLFEKIIHPDDRDIQVKAYQQFFDEEIPYRDFIVRVLRKDGVYIHIQMRISVLDRDQDNKPLTLLCTAMDVEEVITLREQISAQVKMLDEISFKNSHDLRGPVATILGLIQLIDYEHVHGCISEEIIACLKKSVMKLDAVIHEINEHTYTA